MSKFKSKYEYKNGCNNNVRRFLVEDSVRSSDECDISQKIKNLEIEGLKLRSQVEDILHETSETISNRTSDSTMGSSITACEDSGRNAPRYGTIKPHDSRRTRADPIYEHCEHMDNDCQIDDYHQRLEEMQHKLKQDLFAHNLEKERLYETIEELKRVNFRLQTDIEKQSNDFQAMERNYHSTSDRLRSNLSQLLNINKKQEETLLESGARLEELCGAEVAVRAMEHLRDLLIDMEYYRGMILTKDQDVDTSAPNELVSLVERGFKEYSSDIDKKNRKIKDLEDESIQLKRSLTHDKEKSLHDLRNQLAYVEEQNNYLKQHISEINENTDREIDRLREENSIIKSKMDEDMENATGIIDGLEQNLQELSNKNKKMNESWVTEKKSFEKVLDSHEKQIAIIRSERDQALNQKSSLSAKLDASQNQLSDTETALLQLQSDKYAFDKQIEILRKQNKDMETSIASSKKNFENIFKTIRSCGDNDNNRNNNFDKLDDSLLEGDDDEDDKTQIWKPKKYQIEEAIQLIKCLSKREQEVNLKFDKVQKEYEQLERKLETVDLQRRKIEQSFKAQQLDIDSAKNENSHVNSLIANRNSEIERLTAERDYYFQLLNEKTEEVATMKTEKHRLAASLEERCRLLETKGDATQCNDIQRPYAVTKAPVKDQIIREDRNRLMVELKEIKASYDDLLSHREEESRNLGIIRQENWNLKTDLKNASKEYDEILSENRKLSMKLKESENEIANLCREMQNNHGIKSKKHSSLEKKIAELVSELSSNKNELKIAHDRIKYLEKRLSNSSSKAQQPIILNDPTNPIKTGDNLKVAHSRLSNLEQQMLTLDTNQSNLRDENYKLTDLLRKVTSQNERMSEELECYVEENKTLRKKVSSTDTQRPYGHSRKMLVAEKPSHKLTEKRNKIIVDQPSDNYSNELSNDESLKQLRQDLQGSIKEAKRLLSHSPLIESGRDNHMSSKNNDFISFSERSSNNQSSSGSNNNNNVDKCSDPTDSSTVNTRRSESTSLTEADRYIHLPLNKVKDSNLNCPGDERPSSAVQELLSPHRNESAYVKKSNRDSYMLEEKIKRLLATEG